MDGEDRLRSRADRGGGCAGVDVEGVRIDVHENRPGGGPRDRAGAGEEREGGRYHLVAGAHIRGKEGQKKRIAAGSHADRVTRGEPRGDLLLEEAHLVPEDERLSVDDTVDRAADLALDGPVLRLQVEERNRARFHGFGACPPRYSAPGGASTRSAFARRRISPETIRKRPAW